MFKYKTRCTICYRHMDTSIPAQEAVSPAGYDQDVGSYLHTLSAQLHNVQIRKQHC